MDLALPDLSIAFNPLCFMLSPNPDSSVPFNFNDFKDDSNGSAEALYFNDDFNEDSTALDSSKPLNFNGL